MSAHTPGPWRIGDAGHSVFPPPIHPLKALASGNSRADTRLIAAAPDLLDALRVLADHAAEMYPHFESERGQRDIAAALDAIRKATP